MIHKTTRSILSVLLAALLLVASTPLTPAFAGGGGALSQQSESGEGRGLTTDANGVYQIGSAAALAEFRDKVNRGETDANTSAELTDDIDLSGICSEESDTSWTPIGNSIDNLYEGTFNGDGHTISGLYINSSSANDQGLFGYVSGSGKIEKLSVSGDINGNNYVGGVVGLNLGSVENCHNTGTVTGTGDYVGGVVGDNRGSVINCYNTGTVSGNRVGGVVGYNISSVTNCYNTGTVTGTDDYVGGVVGDNSGSVENCYNTGAVNSSGNYVGGVVGYNSSSVENCYNTGKVTGSSDYSYIGGVVGYNSSFGNVTGCYFLKTDDVNKDLQGIGNDSGDATNLTTDEFKNTENFANWDFDSTDIPGIWETNTTLGRPVLKDNHEDDGSKDHPYEIFTATQLETFRDLVNRGGAGASAHAKLMNNIDLSSVCGANAGESGQSVSWTPIGNSSSQYRGTFNGNGHTIENLYINNISSDYQGLFGRVNGGTVKDLTVSGNVSGDRHVGGVVGYNSSGTVTGCIFSGSGSVSGDRCVGGVVGDNRGSVENCYNTGAVNSSGNYVGGVVGYNIGSVTNCYNTGTGSVNGSADSSNVGGVVGLNRGTVENCYNTDSVSDGTTRGGVVGQNSGSVKNCYFLQTTEVNDKLQGIGGGSGTSSNVEPRTADAFHSGEVAWRLQAGQKAAGEEDPIPQVWGQSNLNTDKSWPTLVALDNSAQPVYQVTFDYGTSFTDIDERFAYSYTNGVVSKPDKNPELDGHTLSGWYSDESLTTAWDFSTAVTKNMTLYAQWTAVEEPIPTPTPTPTPDPTPSGPSTGDSSGWDDIRDELENAENGDQITIDMGDETKVPAEIFESLAGKDVDVTFDLGDIQWSVNGADIPTDTDFTDLDLGASLGTSGIPVNVINTITGEVGTVQITLAHNGEFGFTMTLTAPLGKENAGYWANLYHYDEEAEALNFEAAAKIDEDGSVAIPFSHASQYAIVIDTHSHAAVSVSDLFIDVAPDAWYKDAIQYAYDNGLMTGVSDTEFAPEATTTRAMIVSILARLEGVTTAQAAGFADVDDEWYATAVNWAANVGVVNGYEDNTFRPNTAITREQLAAILMNYAAYKGEDVSNRADLTSYTDQPSTWAQEAMQWAVAEGLISGVTNDQLQPQGNATRAQVAAILQRFLDN